MIVLGGEEDVVEEEEKGDGVEAVLHFTSIIIVTGYYKLHDLHVFTVDSLHSVQTLGRVIFHSKGHSETSSIHKFPLMLSRPFCRLFTLAFSLSADAFHRQRPYL